jgi:methylated-DNA-[protein]-cysteine S-methyltransferase
VVCQTFDSPFGPMHLVSNGRALVSLSWGAGNATGSDAVTEEGIRQLTAYFAGTRRDFDLPLEPGGTSFRTRVWDAMCGIAYARVATYGDIARAIGSAPRAVGGACGANPLPIVIPCHRVVGHAGVGGGYSGWGGMNTKAWLLDHEQKHAG